MKDCKAASYKSNVQKSAAFISTNEKLLKEKWGTSLVHSAPPVSSLMVY